jgi:hypothetical protein
VDAAANPSVDARAFHEAMLARLTERLAQLPSDLGLDDRHFLCGVSQMATGADMLFARACRDLGLTQRVALPQPRDAYLDAVGSDGSPDFAPSEREEAQALLDSPHVIDERVVSDAPDRQTRFEETNQALVESCDAVVCLLRAGAEGKRGGTRDLMERARLRGLPLLELRADLAAGAPVIEERWHRRELFRAPALPADLSAAALPPADGPPRLPKAREYSDAWKEITGGQANWRRRLFKTAALAIIGTHVAATCCAVAALKLHAGTFILWLLAFEAVLLACGFGVHRHLHHSRAARVWAVSRLLTELARSVRAAGVFHGRLDYLFVLPLPADPDLLPLLRTVDVLHLRSARAGREEPWQPQRDAYVETRLRGRGGQLAFYGRESARAHRQLKTAQRTFVVCSLTACAATLSKLGILAATHHGGKGAEEWTSLLGMAAVVLPVLAVAGLSLAAAFDLEARSHTFEEMHAFLQRQERRLLAAGSAHEFAGLLAETEGRLLGETVNWYARRAFTGVA